MGRDLSERRARPEAVPLVPAPKRWAWARGAATRPFAGSRGHAALTLLLPQNRGLAPRGGRCRGHVSPCRGCHGFLCLPSRLSSLAHAAPDPSSAGRPCRARGRGVEPVSGALPWSPRARHVRRAGAPGPRGVCASSRRRGGVVLRARRGGGSERHCVAASPGLRLGRSRDLRWPPCVVTALWSLGAVGLPPEGAPRPCVRGRSAGLPVARLEHLSHAAWGRRARPAASPGGATGLSSRLQGAGRRVPLG